MKPELSRDGVSIQTFDEINSTLVSKLQSIYGEDIDLSDNTPDGQRVGFHSSVNLDLQAALAYVYSQLDPDYAQGQFLNTISKISGLIRNAATRSYVDVTIVVDRQVTLPIDYIVEDDTKQRWVTTSEITIASGTHTITLYAEKFGKVEALANTITNPLTVVLGVVSITNPAIAIAGENEETDEKLRKRRNSSTAIKATSNIASLMSKLYAVKSVTNVKVYENSESTEDSTLSLDPHSIWCIVEGGAVQDIAKTIILDKNPGCGLKGSVEYDYTESITQRSLSPQTITHTVRFDRPTDTPVYVKIDVKRRVGTEEIDNALIAKKIAEKIYNIGENLIVYELYTLLYDVPNLIVIDLEVSVDNTNFTGEQLVSTPAGKFSIDEANITVTEI